MPKPLSMFLFAGMAWALWNTRNKMAIESIFPNNGLQPLFVGLGFLQRWTPLLKVADRDKIRELVEVLKAWATNVTPAAIDLSDVGFIYLSAVVL